MQSLTFGVNVTPPMTDPNVIMQRADEVKTIQGMLADAQVSAVMLIGNPGVGKSTVAALLYHRLLLAKQAGMPAPRHLVWLSLNSYTTLPDMIAAMLSSINTNEADLFLLKPEQQMSLLLQALRRPQENALIVLDQFESLLHPETSQGVAGRGGLHLFLELLQTDLGASRILLTSYHAPFDQQTMEQSRIRSYLISRISIPEGVTLLQQRGVKGTPEELSMVWQRCGGHVFALVLFSALVHMSGIAPGYLLLSPEYQSLWRSEVTINLVSLLYQHLNPIQNLLLRALSLFSEPVPLRAITTTITEGNSVDSSNQDSLHEKFELELQLLTRLALVQASSDSVQEGRYAIHPLLRQFVLEHYLDGADRNSLGGGLSASLGVNESLNPLHKNVDARQVALAVGHMQVANYYQAVAQEQCPPREQRTNVQEVELLIATIRHLCLGWHWQQACDLLFKEGLHESLVRLGAWNTLVGLYTALLPPFGTLTRRDEGLVSSHLGMLYGRIGEYQQSQAYFEQALSIQRGLEDTYGQTVTLANYGELCRIRGEWEQARVNFEQAVLLNKQRQDHHEQRDVHLLCIVLHNMGLLYQSKKNYQTALSCYIYALQLIDELQDSYDKGTILTNLGMLLYEQGRQQEGIAILLAALQLRQTLQDPGVILLERFLIALEQRIGSDTYTRLCEAALDIQEQVFTLLMESENAPTSDSGEHTPSQL